MSGYAAIVLAAGRGSRFRAAGGLEPTKLVATYAGEPLVRHVVRSALAACPDPVIVVTGHAREDVEAALAGLDVQQVYNSDFASGLASTLKAGIAVVPPGATGAVILLGDMPEIDAAIIDRLIEAARSSPAADAVIPVQGGTRGNPVLLSRTLFGGVSRLEGDAGARHIVRGEGLKVIEIAFDHRAVSRDIDTPEDLAALHHFHDRG